MIQYLIDNGMTVYVWATIIFFILLVVFTVWLVISTQRDINRERKMVKESDESLKTGAELIERLSGRNKATC